MSPCLTPIVNWIRSLSRISVGLLACAAFISAAMLGLWFHESPSLRIEPGLIGGYIVAAAGLLACAAVFLIYCRASIGTWKAFQTDRSRLGHFGESVAAHTLRLGLAAAVLVATLPFAFRVTTREVYIVVDDFVVNDNVYAKLILQESAATLIRYRGHHVIFDPPAMESLVRDAADGKSMASLTAGLVSEMRLAVPLASRLRRIDTRLAGRRGDQVFVFSAHRTQNGVPGWPFDTSRIGSRWRCVNEAVNGGLVTEPQVLSLEIVHDPSARFVATLDLEWPVNIPRPIVAVTLLDAANQPIGTQSFDPAAAPTESIGSHGARLQYVINLPRDGQPAFVKISFNPSTAAAMNQNTPEFMQPIPLSTLSLDVTGTAGGAFDLVKKLVVNGDPSRVPLQFPTATTNPRAVKWILSSSASLTPPASLPASNDRIVEIVVGAASTTTAGSYDLVRTEKSYSLGQWRRIWPQSAATVGMPNYASAIPSQPGCEAYAGLVSPDGSMSPAVFRPKPGSRPNHYCVVIPPPAEVPDSQRVAIAHTVIWATSLAALRDDTSHRPMTTRIYHDASASVLPPDVGVDGSVRGVLTQVWSCLFLPAVADEGTPMNSVAVAWTADSFTLIAMLFLVLTISRCIRCKPAQ